MSTPPRPAPFARPRAWWRGLCAALARCLARGSARRVRALAAHHAPHHPALAAELREAADRHERRGAPGVRAGAGARDRRDWQPQG